MGKSGAIYILEILPSKPIEKRFCPTLSRFRNELSHQKAYSVTIWTGSDTIRVSQIRDGKWMAEGGFSVTNLGKSGQDQTNSCRKMDG